MASYNDGIISISLCRGELAASLGERGLRVKNWAKLKSALARAESYETSHRSDGHTGSSAVGDLLLDIAIERNGEASCGLDKKPDIGPDECWPHGKKWFDC